MTAYLRHPLGRVSALLAITIGLLPNARGQNGPEPDRPQPGTTVLDAAFARRLADARVVWPTLAEQAAADGADTNRARMMTCRWVFELLAPQCRPFETPPEMAGLASIMGRPIQEPVLRSFMEQLTPAILANGTEVMCHRWSAGGYNFQLEMTNTGGWLCIASRAPRAALEDAEAAAARVDQVLRSVLKGIAPSLDVGRLVSAPQPYGFTMRYRANDDAVWSEAVDAAQHPEATWVMYMRAETDGNSVALSFPAWVYDAVPFRQRPRWFAPLPKTGQPASRPAARAHPGPTPEEIEAANRQNRELRRGDERERP
jgi:hypothetical protein